MDEEERIEQDGYIILDVESLSQRTIYTEQGSWVVWEPTVQTHKVTFNELEVIQQTDTGITIMMERDENGQRDILTWPWSRILHITHRTNSDAVSAKNRARSEQEYAAHGMELLEQVVNGEHIPPEEALAHNIVPDYLTPCGHMSSVAASEPDVDVWTCLTCANQWNGNGDPV